MDREEYLYLIDQLGGYCKAKECLNTPTARDEIKEELREALLQYRRDRNFYEVEDWVVLRGLDLDGRICKISNIGDVTISAKPIHPFKSKQKSKHILINGVFVLPIQQWRHAEPEEIQAGSIRRCAVSEFEKFIVMKYPNRSAKVLLQKLEDITRSLKC